MIRVNGIYGAIQGEGVHTGVPMVVVRLQGCTVGCPFCDTKETWQTHDTDRAATIAEALGQNPRWVLASPGEIAGYIAAHHPAFRWALLTGGEPAEQELGALVDALHDGGLKVAVETSGTSDAHVGVSFDWVCVSPKIDMPGGQGVSSAALQSADEIKHVVGKPADIERLDALLSQCAISDEVSICLQPMSQSEQATQLCIRTVKERGWRLSAQLHKYLGLP